MKSDFVLDSAQFSPRNASEGAKKACEVLRKGDEENKDSLGNMERMRARPGKTVLEGENIEIQSRDRGRTIPCRVVLPKAGPTSVTGVFLHFHGGGLCEGGHDEVDPLLHRFANASRCAVVSVGYRLAPENPYPSCIHDCFDVADYVFDHAVERFGGPLQFIGGESAGGYLTMQTFLHLAGAHEDWNSLKGLVLTYGVFSLSYLPTVFTTPNPVCVDAKKILWYYKATFPVSEEQHWEVCRELEKEFGVLAQPGMLYDAPPKHPAISPLYRSLEKLRSRLPTAFFLCGTADPILDDTILMSAHWQIAGGRAVVKFVTGAPHAFVELPLELADCCVKGNELIQEFLEESSLST
ncbi:unnamed protein product [Clonostachys byssicola]|uniref:Alpha/beta hydrolase fold-3 domain-containing protein n=1 Tax=Clonostachys byssicola TaxID=160290 RepID=A0A9N9U6Y3_9HYPO|nr:unnamed protein product [Clonostachys byssicola]